jgi:hypothetical protein
MRFILMMCCMALLLAATAGWAAGSSHAAATRCIVTTPTTDLAPTSAPNDGYTPFGAGSIWYHNADRTIWAHPWQAWRAHRSIKVGWIKPTGSTLHVTGRRLDRRAAPLQVDLLCCYPGHFQASGLTFPKGGCWVVHARAARETLRFVLNVPPVRSRPRAGAA